MKSRDVLAVFNRGIVDRRALARVDVNRVALSAEEQTNWMPRVLGSMSLRPGTRYHGNSANNAAGIYIPFVFSRADTAIIEVTPGVIRIWDNGDTLVTANAVTATVSNGDFTTDLTGWTDADETGAASTHVSGGYLQLLGTRYEEARRRQSVGVQIGIEHRLRVVVERGPLLVRVGTSAGADDVFKQAVLRTGTHSLAFTPGTSTIHLEFASSLSHPVLLDSVSFEAAGVMQLPAPWLTIGDCRLLRWQRINDVVFLACDGYKQRRLERREDNSWSISLYEPNDGPFLGANTDGTRLTPSGISGEITLTSSRNLFDSASIGQLFQLSSQGQKVEANLSSEGAFTNDIRITGVGSSRVFSVIRSGTWTANLTLQRSDGETGNFVDVQTITTNGNLSFDDNLDNSISFYRIGIKSGDYTSGTAEVSLVHTSGSITGVVRVTGYTSATEVTASVLSDLGGTEATEDWQAGAWNDVDGYPTEVVFYEGRLWWLGRGTADGSVSDDFNSFDPDFEGDAGPIRRSIGDGATDRINWALAAQRLIVGSDSAEHSIRSTSFDEPITSANYNVKEASTQGSAAIPVVRVDAGGWFVQAGGKKVYGVNFDVQLQDYTSGDLTALVPDIAGDGFIRSGVQRQPDTRGYYIREDGKASVMVRDRAEDVLAWVIVETDGEIEEMTSLPGAIEDRVFWKVKRTINGQTVRFHEEMFREDQCRGGDLNRQADAAIIFENVRSDNLSGLDHLEGETVVAWGNGKDLGEYTVSGGRIVLSETVTSVIVGLKYTARYKSSKLAVQLQTGTSLTQRSRIDHIGLILADTHAQGLRYGPSFDVMDDLPLVENGADVASGAVWEAYDEDMIEFPGEWDTDNRICLEANAPRPVTVMAAVISDDKQEKTIG